MTRCVAVLVTLALLAPGCTSQDLNHALGTPKNPLGVNTMPVRSNIADLGELSLLRQRYWAMQIASQNLLQYPVPANQMRPYLANGYWIAEFYCGKFLNKTDEAYRRRSFGRSATNDVGTVMQSLLNLAQAGKNAITGVGVATGLADSLWRNYDTAFLISPEIGNVKDLVRANMKNYRAQTLGPNAKLPADWATAQSEILEYADKCSFTGLQALLNRSANDLRKKLNQNTTDKNETDKGTNNSDKNNAGNKKLQSDLNDQNSSLSNGSTQVPPTDDEDGGDIDPAPSSNSPGTAEITPPPVQQLLSNPNPAMPLQQAAFVARWGTSGTRQQWTAALLQAVADVGQHLTKDDLLPVDIGNYCPAYVYLDADKRRLVWAGLLSALARPESDFNPAAKLTESTITDSAGNHVVSRGLLGISQESANGYGCGITDAQQLHDPLINLKCGVRIMDRLVSRDGVVGELNGTKWKGAAAYWHPFRTASGRSEISSWLSQQSYCSLA